jgi:hypothetical protein
VIGGPVEPSGVDEELRRLVPVVRNRPVLNDGLKMPGGIATYLVGGEPDVWLPISEEGTEWPTVVVDGSTAPMTGSRLSLRSLGLAEGLHEVQVGPTRLAFTTIGTLGVSLPSGAAVLGNPLVLMNDRYEYASLGAVPVGESEHGKVWVIGAQSAGDADCLPSDLEPPVFLRVGAEEYVLVGPCPGEVAHAYDPPRPAWLTRAGLHPEYFEAYPPFRVAWVLTRWTRGWSTQAKEALPPERTPPDTVSQEERMEWGHSLLESTPPSHPADSDRWAAYLEVAEDQEP